MPIVLNSSVPLPNLKLYTSISVLLVSSCFYYAISVTSDPNWKLETNSTLFSAKHGDSSSLEEILSMQDEINEKETIIENFNNLQETILAAIQATNRDGDDAELDAEIVAPQQTLADRSLKTRFKDILAFMMQEPICIWVSFLIHFL